MKARARRGRAGDGASHTYRRPPPEDFDAELREAQARWQAEDAADRAARVARFREREQLASAEQLLRSYAPAGATLKAAFRAAAKKTHPDAPGGDRFRWDQVDKAARLLGLLT
jgi:hypothetical protein